MNRDPTLLSRALADDRGSVSVEIVIATPVLIFLFLLIVQFGLWSHATHIAQAAAANGLAAARVDTGTSADGTAAAQNTLTQLGGGPLQDTHVTVSRDTDAVAVHIDGTASSVIPFLEIPVHATATGPRERFIPDVLGSSDLEAVSGEQP